MIFGNIIPLLLAYKYPQEVALIYPPLILVIALIASGYVTYQMKKTGITVIEPDMLNEKESKQLHYPGLKAGLFFGLWMFFITPLLSILIAGLFSFSSHYKKWCIKYSRFYFLRSEHTVPHLPSHCKN